MKKNLVMGTGRGYSFYVLEPYVRSFAKNVPNADLVLFVDVLSDFTRHKLEEVGREVTSQGKEIKLLPFPEELKDGQPANTRWKMFADYLEVHGSEYQQVFCGGSRDLFFQGDPFRHFADQDSYIGFVDNGKGIIWSPHVSGDMDTSFRWMALFCGKNEAEKLKNKVHFGGDTVIGTSKEMKKYADTVWQYIIKSDYKIFGPDETFLNYIAHNDLLDCKKIEIDLDDGIIANLGCEVSLRPLKVDNNLLVNKSNNSYDIVHQYDRYLPLVNLADRLYRSADFEFDERFTDSQSVLDQIFQLIHFGKFDQVLDLFTNYLSNTFNFGATFDKNTAEALKEIASGNKKLSFLTDSKTQGDYFIRLWEVILEKDFGSSTSRELVELLIQRILMQSYPIIMSLYRAEKIVACIKVAEQKGHVISTEFKKFVLEKLFERAKFFVDMANIPRYLTCMDLVADLNLPLDENWRRLKYEAHYRFCLMQPQIDMTNLADESKELFAKQKILYRPYRIDADLENGGIK